LGSLYKQFKLQMSKSAAKGSKSFAVFLLILICLLSSCTIRKSIQSFFSDTAVERTAVSGKSLRNLWTQQHQFGPKTVDCSKTYLNSSPDDPLFKQSISKTAVIMLFEFILPVFILSLLLPFKKLIILHTPESQWRWSVIPLFLQNRLLLI